MMNTNWVYPLPTLDFEIDEFISIDIKVKNIAYNVFDLVNKQCDACAILKDWSVLNAVHAQHAKLSNWPKKQPIVYGIQNSNEIASVFRYFRKYLNDYEEYLLDLNEFNKDIDCYLIIRLKSLCQVNEILDVAVELLNWTCMWSADIKLITNDAKEQY